MERQELENLINEHHSIRRMAEAAGVPLATIRHWLKVWGMKSNGNEHMSSLVRMGLKNRVPKPLGRCRYCGKPLKRHPTVYCSVSCCQLFERKLSIEKGTAGRVSLRNYLLETRVRKCEVCGLSEWMGKPIPLEMDHKDGHPENNSLDNLRLICPSCHSQTDNYKNKNMGRGRAYRRERYAKGKSY